MNNQQVSDIRLDYEVVTIPKYEVCTICGKVIKDGICGCKKGIPEGVCKRCGKCCYYYSNIDKMVKKCKHLIWIRGTGRYICRIYNRRNAKLRAGKAYLLEKDCVCVLRKNSQYDYPGCPFNSGKPIAPWCINEGVNNG